METFAFKATSPNGSLESGSIEARSKAEAFQFLLRRDLRPVSLSPLSSAPASSNNPPPSSQKPLSSGDLLLFTEELAELLESGLQLDQALKVIESRSGASSLRSVASSLRSQVREGVSFSAALRLAGGGFSELYCSMAAAGEAAGALPRILRRQADYLALIIDLRRRVSAALIYPSIVFSAGIVLLFIFMTFLLPQLTLLLSKTGQKLPLMTRLLIDTSEFFAHYGWLLALLAALAAALFWSWKRQPSGRLSWDRTILHLPIVGPAISSKYLAEFCQTIATLSSNGVPLLHALSLFQRATANVYLKGLLSRLLERVSEGSSLAFSLRQLPFFPGLLVDIVSVGEQSGDLPAALQRGAKRYDRDFSLQVQRITALIQPLTILIVALFVGLVAYSMITGILSSVSGLRSR